MIIFLIKKLNGLFPADSVELGKLQGLKNGQTYKAKITQPRNVQHHRKYWAMIGLVHENLPEEMEKLFKTPNDLHTELKLQAGLYDIHYTIGGKQIPQVRSINFGAMDQLDFEEYYENTIRIISKYILPGITSEDIKNQLLDF